MSKRALVAEGASWTSPATSTQPARWKSGSPIATARWRPWPGPLVEPLAAALAVTRPGAEQAMRIVLEELGAA